MLTESLRQLIAKAETILASPTAAIANKIKARQLLLLTAPLSTVVETYLHDNEGRPQSLDQFSLMRAVYDEAPQRLLLKCSRKTLKSTLLSNMIVLNLIRYPFYKMLYLAPQEISTKYFSNNYLNARFDSPGLKRIMGGFDRNDVFEKILKDTKSSVILRYCKDDATRIRGPATDENIIDECQDILADALPIINETMALSKIKREKLAGTPLTTDNTINELWKASSQNEWMMKCTSCNHWNSLTEDNDPMKMIQPKGLSCSKCDTLLNSNVGEWVCWSPSRRDFEGYHLAQPILGFFNQDPKEWNEVYKKVWNTGTRKYSVAQIFNEVFGLAYDVGAKPITEEELKKLVVLGDMATAYDNNRHKYSRITCGVDWGVNMESSRTAVVIGGLRDDGIYEVFFGRILKDFAYERHIEEIAKLINHMGAYAAADAGPDVARGKKLGDMVGWDKLHLVRYEDGLIMQQYKQHPQAIHEAQNRWCLHRSDTMGFVFDLLKKQQILFPRWEDMEEGFRDILNIFIEVREGMLRQQLFYRHGISKPDDFFHALNFAVCLAHMLAGNPLLYAPSSTAITEEWRGGNEG